jgi:hypothetical protein
MAGQRLTDKTALEQQTGSGDLFMVVDVNDTTGSAAGTSKKIDSKFVIQTDKISVSNAELVALDDGGGAGESKTIVSAPGSGYIIVPLQTTIIATHAGSNETSNKSLYVGWDATQTLVYYTYWSRIMSAITSGTRTYLSGASAGTGSNPATIDNLPLLIWTNGTLNGGWSCDIYITYQIVKLS